MNTKRSRLLNNVEGYILELLLSTYFLHLIAGTMKIYPHYLLIVMAFVGGIIAYLTFLNRPYSILINLIISLLMITPFIIISMPFVVCVLLFTLVSWRFHVHFGLERAGNWNFLALNTIIMTSLFLVAKVYFLKPDVMAANITQIKLFILTTLIFIVLRYVLIILEGKWQNNTNMKEVTRVFGGLTLIAGAVFVLVNYAIEPVRNFILMILRLTFGKLFYLVASLFPDFDEEGTGPGQLPGGVDDGISFAPEKEITQVASESVNLSVIITIITVIILVVALVVLLRKRKRDFQESTEPMYTVRSNGRKKKKVDQAIHYDYSQATNEIRTAMQEFEEAASAATYPRFIDETVKEWFKRMKWTENDSFFSLYDRVRYGNQSISHEEVKLFINTLDEIKKVHFNENV